MVDARYAQFFKLNPDANAFKDSIGSQLAELYTSGLNGAYKARYRRGLDVAVQTPKYQLIQVIKSLLADRKKMGAETPVTTNEIDKLTENQLRALVLGLWSNRIPKLKVSGETYIAKQKAVYGDQHYMPPVDESFAVTETHAHLASSSNKTLYYQPTLEDADRVIGSRELAPEELRAELERDANYRELILCPDWWEKLQADLDDQEP